MAISLTNVLDAWRSLGALLLSFGRPTSDDDEMPKVNPPATNVKKFEGLLQKDFQERFDAWKAETERDAHGIVEITHEEIVAQGMELLIFYRVTPKPAVSRPRR